MSPCEWAFIMMPPGLTIGFILSLLLVATMLPEEVKVTQEEGQREREREGERGRRCFAPNLYNHQRDLVPLSNSRHLESAAMFFCRLLLRPGKEKDCWSMKKRERERKLNRWIRKSWKKERGGERSGVNERKKLIMESGEEWLDDLLTYWSGRRMEDWKMVERKG